MARLITLSFGPHSLHGHTLEVKGDTLTLPPDTERATGCIRSSAPFSEPSRIDTRRRDQNVIARLAALP